MDLSIELLVSLKIPDVTAITARRTLQRRMGYAEVLAELTRADWWRIGVVAADQAAARALGRELAEETNCFVNPNKHVCRVVTAVDLPPAGPGQSLLGVLTGFVGEATGDMTAAALRGRLGYGDRVTAVERGTLWTFRLNEPDADRARALVEEITISRGRESGLLVNPHSMWWRWAETVADASVG
ncbi:MAG: hypothetical protein HYU66_16070 [Armatimonadetes bacterium]|nr:hypothetical protein [Armatimonadota bacterium]